MILHLAFCLCMWVAFRPYFPLFLLCRLVCLLDISSRWFCALLFSLSLRRGVSGLGKTRRLYRGVVCQCARVQSLFRQRFRVGACMGPAVGLRFVHIFSYSVTLTAALTIQALYHNIYTSMHPFIGLSSCSCPGPKIS